MSMIDLWALRMRICHIVSVVRVAYTNDENVQNRKITQHVCGLFQHCITIVRVHSAHTCDILLTVRPLVARVHGVQYT